MAKTVDNDSRYAGWLMKRNKKGKVQKRYCVICDGAFYYYKDEYKKNQKGCIRLNQYRAEDSSTDKQYCFILDSATRVHEKEICFITTSKDSVSEWVKAINTESWEASHKVCTVREFHPQYSQGSDFQIKSKSLGKKYNHPEYFGNDFTEMKSTSLGKNYKYPMNSTIYSPTTEASSSKRSSSDSDDFDEFSTHSLFHAISRQESESLLISKMDGTYLLRQDTTKEVLSIKVGERMIHYKLFDDNGDKFIHEHPEPRFQTLEELLTYYKNNKLPTVDMRLNEVLKPLHMS